MQCSKTQHRTAQHNLGTPPPSSSIGILLEGHLGVFVGVSAVKGDRCIRLKTIGVPVDLCGHMAALPDLDCLPQLSTAPLWDRGVNAPSTGRGTAGWLSQQVWCYRHCKQKWPFLVPVRHVKMFPPEPTRRPKIFVGLQTVCQSRGSGPFSSHQTMNEEGQPTSSLNFL